MNPQKFQNTQKKVSKSGSLYDRILCHIKLLVTHSKPFNAMLSLPLYKKSWTKTHAPIHTLTRAYPHLHMCIYIASWLWTRTLQAENANRKFYTWYSAIEKVSPELVSNKPCLLPTLPLPAPRVDWNPIGNRIIRISIYVNIFRRVVRIVRFKCNASVYCRNMGRILT